MQHFTLILLHFLVVFLVISSSGIAVPFLTVADRVLTSVLKSHGFWVHIHQMYANQTGVIRKASS